MKQNIEKKENLKNFWQEQIKKYGKLCILAPMDGYGDSAYRQTIKKIAPHVLCVSEFFSADGLVHSKFLADSALPHTNLEKPLIIQIFGKDPETFAKASKIIEQKKYGIFGIDINMGCPAKKVVRSGHGSSLLINENTAFDIVKTMDEATKLPVSVKTRLSFDGGQDLIKFGKGLEKAGCKLLTIHGRTAKQAYSGVANWEPIYELKKKLNIPVIGNGDVKNFSDGIKKVKNLDGFMIGRGSFGNPWCFIGEKHIKNYSHLNPKNFICGEYFPSLSEILEIMEFHASSLVETKGEHKGSLEIRKHLVLYLKNFPGVKAYRKKLVTTDSIENTRKVLEEIKTEFGEFLEKRPGLGEISKETLGLE